MSVKSFCQLGWACTAAHCSASWPNAARAKTANSPISIASVSRQFRGGAKSRRVSDMEHRQMAPKSVLKILWLHSQFIPKCEAKSFSHQNAMKTVPKPHPNPHVRFGGAVGRTDTNNCCLDRAPNASCQRGAIAHQCPSQARLPNAP